MHSCTRRLHVRYIHLDLGLFRYAPCMLAHPDTLTEEPDMVKKFLNATAQVRSNVSDVQLPVITEPCLCVNEVFSELHRCMYEP